MRYMSIFIVFVISLTALGITAEAAVTDKQVRDAIRKGVKFLENSQGAHGHWDKPAGNPVKDRNHGGHTSMAIYAMLSAGEEWQKNDKMLKGLEFLKKVNITGTYARGVRAHVWAKLPNQQFGQFLRNDSAWLEQALRPGGNYDYTSSPRGTRNDNSVTQYGVLGMWEAAKRNHGPRNANYWKSVENYFVSGNQKDNGGWGYTKHANNTTGSMTAAGLAVLYITLDYAHSADFIKPGQTESHPTYKRINKGLAWMAKYYRAGRNPVPKGKGHSVPGYWMVGVERVGLASGYKYFGKKDWYQTGAEYFVNSQNPNGSWPGKYDKTIETSFALVFLARGRVPVFMNKLSIPKYPWNNRPRDVANLTAWAADEIEVDVNWQVIPISSPPEEWLDAPMLWLSGHKPLELNDKQKAKIKTYIDLGGTLITHADGSSKEFSTSVKKLMRELYPRYELKVVKKEDLLYNVNHRITKTTGIQSINNGIRHLVIHIPHQDIGSAFQRKQQRDMTQWQMMTNIYNYVTERGVIRARLDSHYQKKKSGSANKSIKVARAKYDGNWNPEPGAWINQRIYMFNHKSTDVEIEQVDLTDLADCDASVVHITGTQETKFSDQQIDALKKYVAGGGVVLFETAGGKMAFSRSVQQMLSKAYPDKPIRSVPAGSDLITGKGIDGYNCSRVKYRAYFQQRGAMGKAPLLQMIPIDGQPRIIISNEDLTEAMVNQPVWGVFGYSSESAQKLMSNIILWSGEKNPK